MPELHTQLHPTTPDTIPASAPYDTEYLGHVLNAPIGRRRWLGGLLAGSAMVLLGPEVGAQTVKSEIHDLRGTVRVNGVVATRRTVIVPGDKIETGNDGYIVFAVGSDAFMLRNRSEVLVSGPATGSRFINALQLVTGALGAVFESGRTRQIRVANVTAGIRGTGVYFETRGDGVYFCTCFGKVELGIDGAPNEREFVESTRHVPRMINRDAKAGAMFLPAKFETHTDGEMEMLERCVGRKAPWV
jgi:hypothetical protein